MPESSFVPLPGSERGPLTGADVIGPVDTGQRIEVTLVTRRRAELPPDLVTGPSVLSRDEMAARHGTDPADLTLISEVLAQHGIEVTGANPGARRVKATGTAGAFGEAFGASLTMVRSPHPTARLGLAEHRYREGGLRLPAELGGIVLAVLGLDDRPQATAAGAAGTSGAAAPAPPLPRRSPTPRTRWPGLYQFPAGTDGTGADHRDHRARRRLRHQRPRRLLLRPGHRHPGRDRGQRGRRRQPARPGPDRGRRGGPAGHRGRRRGRARGRAGRLLRAQHRPGLRRRDHHRGPRHARPRP